MIGFVFIVTIRISLKELSVIDVIKIKMIMGIEMRMKIGIEMRIQMGIEIRKVINIWKMILKKIIKILCYMRMKDIIILKENRIVK